MIVDFNLLSNSLNGLVSNTPAYYLNSKLYFEVMLATGCRPTEPLMLELWQPYSKQMFRLMPLKGNKQRLVEINSLPIEFQQAVFTSTPIFEQIFYPKFLYQFNRLFALKPLLKDSKDISLYAFRYHKFKRLAVDGFSREQIKIIMGENSLSVSNGYVDAVLVSDN